MTDEPCVMSVCGRELCRQINYAQNLTQNVHLVQKMAVYIYIYFLRVTNPVKYDQNHNRSHLVQLHLVNLEELHD